MEDENKKIGRLNTTHLILLGFLVIIIIGAILLSMPFSSADGQFTSFIDSLFTSTTSVCVTGLTTVTTATHWSLVGKIIILLLIQFGGLGLVCCGIMVLVALGKRITLKDRMLIRDTYNLESIKGIVQLIIKIFKGTLVVEAIGAILYTFAFIPEFGVAKGTWYSIFHSISAFCNAGIDLIGENSFVPYVNDPIVNITTMLLIVVGGIGFIVWWDIAKVIKNAVKLRRIKGQLFLKLKLHSKIAIVVTIALIFGGALLVFIFEYGNDSTIGQMNIFEKIMASFFQSITGRTAGFAAIDQHALRDATVLIMLILMFIGGSPSGTAGGMKTTTIGMLLLVVVGVVRGRRDTEAFDRRIGSENIKTGLSVVIIGGLVFIVALLGLAATQDMSLKDIAYEAMSAISTTGLTRGITSSLDVFGKLIIIVLMFVGRIGPITMAMAFNMRRPSMTQNIRELPKKNIMVG